MRRARRWSAVLMAFVLVLSCFPFHVRAEDDDLTPATDQKLRQPRISAKTGDEVLVPAIDQKIQPRICAKTNDDDLLSDSDQEIHQTRLIIKNKDGREVTVLFADSNTGATYRDVQCIVNDDPDISQFTIYRVGNDESAGDSFFNYPISIARIWSPPLGSTHKYETVKTVTVPSRVVKDDFVISVAKGQTVTLKSEYTGTLTGSISGDYFSKSNLGINLSVTCKYSTSYKFTGPTSGNYNSREYRVKYFREDGNYIQKDYCYKPTGDLYGIRSCGGAYQEAVKYAAYSKDSRQ